MQHNSEIARQHEAHIARRARLFNRQPKPVLQIAAPVVEERQPRDERDHVDRWLSWVGSPLKSYIAKRAVELGSTYDQMIGPSRRAYIVAVRHQIIWEIKTEIRPTISYPELGRLFARDHTSILSSIRRHGTRRDQSKGATVSDYHVQLLRVVQRGERFDNSVPLKDRISLKKRGFVDWKVPTQRWILTEQGVSHLKTVR